MERLKRILNWKPDIRLVALGAVAAFVLLMIPLLRIVLYSVPYYDDYIAAKFVRDFLREENSLRSALRGAWYTTKTSWYAWQGTYTATFLNSLAPIAWREQAYFMGPIFLIIFLPMSVCMLVGVLLRRVLKADRVSCIIIQAVTSAMIVVLLYSPQQGFYWHVGGLCYVGLHSLLLLLVAGWVGLLAGAGRGKTAVMLIGTLIGAGLAGGANYVTALQGILICLGIVALGIIFRRRRVWLLLPSLLIYGYGFYKNVSAPGNRVRAAYYVGWGYSPVEAVLRSFLEAFLHLGEFSGWITVAILALLVPVVWRMVGKTVFSYRLPGLVLAGSFCLYATGFTPTLYAMGHGGYGRVLNCVKITYQLLLVMNEVYWLGWLRGKLAQKGKTDFRENAPWWFYGGVGVAMLFIFLFFSRSQAGCYSSYGAYYFVHTGEAYNYYQDYLKRIETIVNSGPDAVVEPYSFKPWFLCIKDLSENPSAEENRAMADWYGKNSISCVASGDE